MAASAFAIVALADLRAQMPSGNAAVQQSRLFNQRPTFSSSASSERLFPPPEGMEGGESAADADLGEQWILKPNVPANPFNAHASLSLFATDNVALSRRSALSDLFAVADIGLGYTRPLAQDWALLIGAQQSFFRYDQYTEFDFESSNANAALSHQARGPGNIVFSLQYGFSRLTSGSADNQLYLGNSFALAATKVVQIRSADSVDFNGAIGYTLADPDSLERAELRFAIGYNLRVARSFTATAAARVEFFDYTNVSREDLLQSVALGARWEINENIAMSGSISAANNLSTQPVFTYQAINGGATLTAHIRF